MVATPELDKMSKVKEQSQAIGEFMEWLNQEHGVLLAVVHEHEEGCWGSHEHDNMCIPSKRGCKRTREYVCGATNDSLVMFGKRVEDLLYEFFEVDPKKAEQERRALLEEARKA